MEAGIDLYQPILGSSLLEWISEYGYFVLVPLLAFEGRIVGLIASALSRLGVLNIYLVWALVIFSATLSNIFYYFLGRSGTNVLKRFEMAHKTLERIKLSPPGTSTASFLDKHGPKVFFFTKTVPSVSWPLQIVAGASRMEAKKYFLACFAADLVWSTIIVGVGYFMGYLAQELNIYLVLGIVVLMIFGLYFSGRRLLKRFLNKSQ